MTPADPRPAPEFELPNVAAGPDPFSLSALPASVRFAVLVLQRDHFCTNCRAQVRALADRYGEFRARDAEVVSVVPEPLERVREWQRRYELPFPLLADPGATVGDAYDQPVRFGPLGRISDFFGRMPVAAVVDRRADPPALATVHRGDSTFDRPGVGELLADLDALGGEA